MGTNQETLRMSTNPFQRKAGADYGNRLNRPGDVSVGVETKKKEDFLKNVKNRLVPWATFQDVFDDEDELKLIVDSLKFDMGWTDDIKDADALKDAVEKCVATIQSDTLGELKEDVEEILDEISTD